MSAGPRQNETSDSRRPDEQSDLTWLDFLRSAGGTVPPHSRHSERDEHPGRTDSAERKRRHTGSDSWRRNHRHTTFGGRTSNIHGGRVGGDGNSGGTATTAGSSRSTAIDLTWPPRQATRPDVRSITSGDSGFGGAGGGASRLGLGLGRRESDFVLPRWQPDHEVSQCPFCETDFSLLYRRHHCRKCGRVVCARCSPHRITIPRQYIVQPQPPHTSVEGGSTTSYTWGGGGSNSALGGGGGSNPALGGGGGSNLALGGGEIVRVCKPCVPDPWTPDAALSLTAASSSTATLPPPPPPPSTTAASSSTATSPPPPPSTTARGPPSAIIDPPRLHPSQSSATMYSWTRPDSEGRSRRPERYRPADGGGVAGRNRVYDQGRTVEQVFDTYALPPRQRQQRRPLVEPPGWPIGQLHRPGEEPIDGRHLRFMTSGERLPDSDVPTANDLHDNASMRFNTFGRGVPGADAPTYAGYTGHRRATSALSGMPPVQIPPTSNQSPPVAAPSQRRIVAPEDECPVCGEEMAPGEAVREQHIDSCFRARAAVTTATPPLTGNTGASASAPPLSNAAVTAAASSRPRATSFRPRGMAKHLATEKDCVEANGEPKECEICLEEFEPGVELGRLECFCLFHAACIRAWWNQKGQGTCPRPHFD